MFTSWKKFFSLRNRANPTLKLKEQSQNNFINHTCAQFLGFSENHPPTVIAEHCQRNKRILFWSQNEVLLWTWQIPGVLGNIVFLSILSLPSFGKHKKLIQVVCCLGLPLDWNCVQHFHLFKLWKFCEDKPFAHPKVDVREPHDYLRWRQTTIDDPVWYFLQFLRYACFHFILQKNVKFHFVVSTDFETFTKKPTDILKVQVPWSTISDHKFLPERAAKMSSSKQRQNRLKGLNDERSPIPKSGGQELFEISETGFQPEGEQRVA